MNTFHGRVCNLCGQKIDPTEFRTHYNKKEVHDRCKKKELADDGENTKN